MDIPQERILNVKNKPEVEGVIELKSIEDLKKLVAVGNLVCLYEDEEEKIYFVQKFVFREKN